MMIETSLQLWWFCFVSHSWQESLAKCGKMFTPYNFNKQKLFHAMTAKGIEAFLSVLRNSSCTSKNCTSRSWIPLQVHRCCNSLWLVWFIAAPLIFMQMIFFAAVQILFVVGQCFSTLWKLSATKLNNFSEISESTEKDTENLLFYIRRKRSKSRKEGSKKRTLLKIHPSMEIKNKQRASKKSSICWTLDGFSNNSKGNAAQMWRQSFLEIRVLVQCASQQICFSNSLANRRCRRPTMKCCMCLNLAVCFLFEREVRNFIYAKLCWACCSMLVNSQIVSFRSSTSQ